MRGKNLVQLVKSLNLLSSPGGTTRRELAARLGISDRSVSRCLRTIEDLGIPIYDERPPFEKEKRWRIESTYLERLPNLNLPRLDLTYPELISLCMLVGESVVFAGTEIDRHIQTALSKLMHFVPKETQKEISDLKRIFICKTIGSKAYTGMESVIENLIECILDRRACNITYHVFYRDKIEATDIGPLHFYENNGGLYLFAVKLTEDTVRTYAVERIKSIRLLDHDVAYPENFNPEEKLNSAFDLIHDDPVFVKIRFSKSEARYIQEKTWAENQTLTQNPDGSIILSMTTSGYRDVKRWVMSFGREARLLEPEKMKTEIEAELKEILGIT